ncbi:hypothetical protein WJX74_008686 [Apatococcus lobatus]|uniref:ATP-dependent Clp protease proteolytic subunit n=1 Tax=Apatococcus lobatus TaxID=904363 RepID=A0AAW1RZ78_9CHLO
MREMAALGITPEAAVLEEEEAMESLRATSCYAMDKVNENTRMTPRMSGGGGGTGAAPGQAPPDLPSLLLDGRICFIGMALVPAVTELVISELLWLNYSAPDKPVYVYINSIGSQDPLGRPVGFETEAYAILDTLNYIRPEIHTLAVGNAFGNAAMILASGKKGNRFSLPNARITLAPPRMNRSFGNASNIMIKANELENNTSTYVEFMSQYTGKDKEVVRKDIGRNRYFTPQQAIEYGVVDRIVQPSDAVAIEGKNYEAQLQASQAQQRSQRVPAGAGASAEGGY